MRKQGSVMTERDYSADPRSKKIDYQLQQAGRGGDQVDQNRGDEDGRISQAQSDVQPKDTKSITGYVYFSKVEPSPSVGPTAELVSHVAPMHPWQTDSWVFRIPKHDKVSDLVKENPDDK